MACLGFLNIIFIRIPILFLYYKLFNIKDSIGHKFYVILLFLSLSFYNFLLLVPPPVKRTHIDTREKSCFSNQRVIMGAIEMYNMDNKQMMTSIDFSRLLEGKYLKEIPQKPTNECDYFSEGDLSEDGYISCKKHGSVYLLNKKSEKESEEAHRIQEEKEKTIPYKVMTFFSSFDGFFINFSNNLLDVFERIIRLLPFWEFIGTIIFYSFIFGFGFTIRTTTLSYLGFSVLTLFLLLYEYFSTKYKINMANQKSIKVSVHNKIKYNKRTDCNNIKF